MKPEEAKNAVQSILKQTQDNIKKIEEYFHEKGLETSSQVYEALHFKRLPKEDLQLYDCWTSLMDVEYVLQEKSLTD